MNTRQIATLFKVGLIGQDRNFNHISIDTRTLVSPSNTVFFALEGKNHDGHKYIQDAYDMGVRCFVVEKDIDINAFPEASIVKVDNGIDALQQLATSHRSKFTMPVVGITGSNGKTIVKEWCSRVLDNDYQVIRSPRSYNSQVGVPLSVLQMKSDNDMAIFEAGISQPGEMRKLEEIIRPTIGIFTCLGDAHQSNFSSMAEKAEEKAKLFQSCDMVIYRGDYRLIAEAVESLGVPTFTFTINERSSADMYVNIIEKSSTKTKLAIDCTYNHLECVIPYTDEASIENICHVIALMFHLHYTESEVRERIKLLTPIAMRMEQKQGANGCTLINDTYNSDLGSLSIALDVLCEQVQNPSKTVILSDILQSNLNSDRLYLEIGHMLAVRNVNRLIGIGSNISSHPDCFKAQEALFFESTEEFLKNMPSFYNEAILIKGSRDFRFERIVNLLQEKDHQTVMEINLDAFVNNLNHFRSLLKPSTKIVAMVKAFSYGSGSYEIANLLNHQRIDYLAVAFADEGKALRDKGIKTPIIVMNPEPSAYDTIIKYKLEPEVYHFKTLKQFAFAVKSAGKTDYPVHLKIDTGMNRLGFRQEELDNLLIALDETKDILKVVSIFSHLATADDPDMDEFTLSQIEKYDKMSTLIKQHIGNKDIIRHILNSAGIERFPQYQFDMVRLGIGLYGISAVGSPELMEVSSLKSVVLQIKHIKQGESVGYGRKHIADKDETIGIVPVGYADGLRRALGNGVGLVKINNQFAPIIGNICMDVCMVDLTDIQAKEGDNVIFFGPDYSVNETAKRLNTISYEILTAISPRVKRIYYQE